MNPRAWNRGVPVSAHILSYSNVFMHWLFFVKKQDCLLCIFTKENLYREEKSIILCYTTY